MDGDVKPIPAPAPDLRAGRVARTEAALIAAARTLFIQQGYVSTTLAQVAGHAGVATRTVYVRFGNKATLFRRVVDHALVGDTEPIDVAHRLRTRDAMNAPTLDDRIEAFVDVAIGIAQRAGALFEVAAQAEGLEPELAQAAQAGRYATSELCAEFWAKAVDDGLLDPGTDVTRLAVATDIMICADTVVHLRRVDRWSPGAHRNLIIVTVRALTDRSRTGHPAAISAASGPSR